MTARHHYNINLPVEFHQIKIKNKNASAHYERTIPLETLYMTNKPLVDWLESLNLCVTHGRFFQSYPNQVYYRHIDILQPKEEIINQADVPKLNFIFNSWGSKMAWFKLLDGKTGVPRVNAHGDRLITYLDNAVTEIYSADVDTHCLIDGGTIHNLTNSENKGINRLCYSLWLQYHDDPQKTFTWNAAIKIFKPYIY